MYSQLRDMKLRMLRLKNTPRCARVLKLIKYTLAIVIFVNIYLVYTTKNKPQKKWLFADMSVCNPRPKNFTKICYKYRKEMGYVYKVQANFYNTNMTSDSADDVTMVTQLTSSRLAALQRLASYWQGWMSVAVYVEEALLSNLKLQVGQWLREANRSNIAVSFVVKRGVSR